MNNKLTQAVSKHMHIFRCSCSQMQSFVSGASPATEEEVEQELTSTDSDNDVRNHVKMLCKEGRLKEALDVLHLMDLRGIRADSNIYTSLFRACLGLKAVAEGNRVRDHMVKTGFEPDIILRNHMVNMYAKCGNVVDARQVFDKMPERTVVSWTTLISGYVQHGCSEDGLKLFLEMQRAGVNANQFTFGSVLRACASLTGLEEGKGVHAHVVKSGFESNVFVGSALVDMYAKCGNIENAYQVFDNMDVRDVVSCSAMIAAHAQNGQFRKVIRLFVKMIGLGMEPNQSTFASVFRACASLAALEEGKQVHAYIVKYGFELDVIVGSALVDTYAKCGCTEDASRVFENLPQRDVILWNAMITAYALNNHADMALNLFYQMQQEGMKPTRSTFATVFRACASLATIEQGYKLHTHVVKYGCQSDVFVGSALLDMYAKCNNLENALKVFERMPERNVVSCNAMLTGYSQLQCPVKALEFFGQMQRAGVNPTQFTFGSIVRACASLAHLDQGKQVHACIIKAGFMSDVIVGNTLIDMYAKCGVIEDACKTFHKMPEQSTVSWTAIITACAQHGHGKEALQLFEAMQDAGMKPNHITFIGVLSACTHVGLVDEGQRHFNLMSQDHGVMPRREHYACMVDLLGRAGHLNEAEDFIHKMPFEPDAVVWRALLGACRIHGNVELAKRVAKHILWLEPHNAGTYVLLSNIFSAAGRWDDVATVRKLMEEEGVKKEPGWSWIEVKNRVHEFVVSGESHTHTDR